MMVHNFHACTLILYAHVRLCVMNGTHMHGASKQGEEEEKMKEDKVDS